MDGDSEGGRRVMPSAWQIIIIAKNTVNNY